MHKIFSLTSTGVGLIIAGIMILAAIPFCVLNEILFEKE